LVVATAKGGTKPIELVGKEKAEKRFGDTGRLRTAVLVDAGVTHAEDDGESLGDLAPLLEELDLSGSLLPSWAAVGAVASKLPSLVALDLSRARLGPVPEGGVPALSRLRVVVLNRTGVTLGGALRALGAATDLEELHLCHNEIRRLDDAPATPHECPALARLRHLALDHNRLEGWVEVERLKHWPALERLHLAGNAHVSDVRCEGGFERLTALLLGGCGISDWASVDAMAQFPALAELRLSGTPLGDGAPGGGRFEVVARMARLKTLNGSAVRPSERRDAEVRYVRSVSAWASETGAADDEVSRRHPRYHELRSLYGEALGAATSQAGGAGLGRMSAAQVVTSCGAALCREPKSGCMPSSQEAGSLESSLLELKLTSVASSKGASMGTQVKKLPARLTVGQLRVMCAKLFNVQPARMSLFVRAPGNPVPEPVEEPDISTLASMGVAPGWEVLVDEVDPEQKRAEQRAAQEAERRRLEELEAEQLRKGDALNAVARAAMGI